MLMLTLRIGLTWTAVSFLCLAFWVLLLETGRFFGSTEARKVRRKTSSRLPPTAYADEDLSANETPSHQQAALSSVDKPGSSPGQRVPKPIKPKRLTRESRKRSADESRPVLGIRRHRYSPRTAG